MSSAVAVDPMPLVLSVLTTSPAVTAIVGTRVHGESLPANAAKDGTIQNFYQPAIVVASSGGLVDGYTLALGYPRLQVRCYAPSRAQARALWFVVLGLLHGQHYQGHGAGLVAELNAGPNVLVEPGNGTPRCDGYFSLQVQPV